MTWAPVIILSVGLSLALVGCGKKEPPPATRPAQLMTPQSRLIFHGGQAIFAICERGNRVYVSETGHFQVIPGACPSGEP